jgi:hypothetical protein
MSIPPLKGQFSPGKHKFSEVIDWIVRTFEGHPQSSLQINALSSEAGIEKRRLYDLVNVLIACGICTKIDTHLYRWHGLSAFRAAAKQIGREIETRAMRHGMKSLFLLPESPTIGVLTSGFIGMFLHFGPAQINIRDAAILMSSDEVGVKPICRRLYLVAFLLEQLGLVRHSGSIGGYEFSPDLTMITIEIVSEMAMTKQFPPGSIAGQLNRIEEPFVRRLHIQRRAELAKIVRSRTGQLGQTEESLPDPQLPRTIPLIDVQ